MIRRPPRSPLFPSTTLSRPPSPRRRTCRPAANTRAKTARALPRIGPAALRRSEEHTSELQSRSDLVCRLLLEKKNQLKCECEHDVLYYTFTHTLRRDVERTL